MSLSRTTKMIMTTLGYDVGHDSGLDYYDDDDADLDEASINPEAAAIGVMIAGTVLICGCIVYACAKAIQSLTGCDQASDLEKQPILPSAPPVVYYTDDHHHHHHDDDHHHHHHQRPHC